MEEALFRIAALLLLLARLAERAAGDTRARRCRALWALQQAETIAAEFVADPGWGRYDGERLWSPAVSMARHGFEPCHAMELAASLRSLSIAVQVLAIYAGSGGMEDAEPQCDPDLLHASPTPSVGRLVPARLTGTRPAPPRLDTS